MTDDSKFVSPLSHRKTITTNSCIEFTSARLWF